VDLSTKEIISKYRAEGIPTKYRLKEPEWHLEQFEKMLNGYYDEEKAVIRIKTRSKSSKSIYKRLDCI
jgi:hypothetical protein